MANKTKYCAKCGKPNSENTRFCSSCGYDFESGAKARGGKSSNKIIIALAAVIAVLIIVIAVIVSYWAGRTERDEKTQNTSDSMSHAEQTQIPAVTETPEAIAAPAAEDTADDPVTVIEDTQPIEAVAEENIAPEKVPFADKMVLDENGCGSSYYDIDFDGNVDCIEMRQNRSYDNSSDGTLNTLKTELIINGDAFEVDNAYKTHGCGAVFVSDIDVNDDYLDIVVLTSYKSADANIYQYRNGEFCEAYVDLGYGIPDTSGAEMIVNDTSRMETGFTILCEGDHTFKKTAQDEYKPYS